MRRSEIEKARQPTIFTRHKFDFVRTLIRQFRRDFHRTVGDVPESILLVDGRSGNEWSWRDVDVTTDLIAAYVRQAGVGEGGIVASMLPNSVEQFLIFLACLKSGFDFAPIPPRSTPAELQRLSLIFCPEIFLTTQEAGRTQDHWPRLEAVNRAIPVDGKFEWLGGINELEPRAQSTELPGARIFVLTGGSTAQPKVVVIDSDRLWSAGCAFVAHHEFLGSDCRFYNIMPMSYLGGLFNLGLIPMAARARTVIAEPFSGLAILRLWRECDRFHINVLWLVPTVVRALVQAAKRDEARLKAGIQTGKGIRAAFVGMAPIELSTKREFEDTFGVPLLENFALSETIFLTSERLQNSARRTEGSVGELLPFVEHRVSTYQSGGGKLTPARIEVRTPFLFLGYLGPGGDLDLPLTDGDFFSTGDLGYIGEDGALILSGRDRDMIKKGGLLISLTEIQALARQVPGVGDAIAVGVPHDFYGEDYVIFVVPGPLEDDGMDEAADLADRVRNSMTTTLSESKWPSRVIAIDKFPEAHSGKVARSKLRDLADSGRSFS